MPLPARWVDHLFAKLTVRYGSAFMRQWPGADIEFVKSDWADVLDGTSAESIAYALQYLPSERPPNAMQFRDLCRRAPAGKPALPPPSVRADDSVVAAAVATASSAIGTPRDRLDWARSIMHRHESGEGLRPTQAALEIAREAIAREATTHADPLAPVDERQPPAGREQFASDPRFAALTAGAPAATRG